MLPPISLDGVLTSRLWSILLRLMRLGALGSSLRVVVFVRFWISVFASTFLTKALGTGDLRATVASCISLLGGPEGAA